MTARSIPAARLSLAALLCACAVPLVTLARGEDKPARRVRVSVVVIYASETGDRIDKKLEEVAREVQKMHPKLTNFELGDMSCQSLPVGQTERFALVDDQTFSVSVQHAADRMERVCLKVRPPLMGEITYSTPCGKFLPIMTPYRTKGNQTVILAVRVKPCGGK